MNTQTIALPANDNILAILNFNKIANDLKREAVKAMGDDDVRILVQRPAVVKKLVAKKAK